jgi:hypothetical protein
MFAPIVSVSAVSVMAPLPEEMAAVLLNVFAPALSVTAPLPLALTPWLTVIVPLAVTLIGWFTVAEVLSPFSPTAVPIVNAPVWLTQIPFTAPAPVT